MRRLALLFLCLSCNGPEAPDSAICQDVIHRLCIPDLCAEVAAFVPRVAECEQQLLAKTGCDKEDFSFTMPDRARMLECRLPLLRVGNDRELHPSCDDVSETFARCADVGRFLGAKQ